MSCRQMEVQVWKSREIRTRENGMGDINAGAIVETLHRNKSERREATGRSILKIFKQKNLLQNSSWKTNFESLKWVA